jgi:hypothetical protein
MKAQRERGGREIWRVAKRERHGQSENRRELERMVNKQNEM